MPVIKVLVLLARRVGRVVECTGLENQRTERYREFESLTLRQEKKESCLSRLFFFVDYLEFFTIEFTISGSSRVEVSPKFVNSPSAILRSILLIIFPDLVLGKPATI